MKLVQHLFDPDHGCTATAGGLGDLQPQLVLGFGPRHLLEQPRLTSQLAERYPGARIVCASTAGEISSAGVTTDRLAVTAIAFEHARVACAATTLHNQFQSRAAGEELARQIWPQGLRHVFVVSDGQLVNGSELVRGLQEKLPAGVAVTGGLAGDGNRFERTLVGIDEVPVPGRLVAIALYGNRLHAGFGSSGGWTAYGPERSVTAAEGNILFQIDGQPALSVYKSQLGEMSAKLPAAALLFPLAVKPHAGGTTVVRTILGVDESTNSLVFAGDVPAGSRVQFMQASQEDLIAGAAAAADAARLSAPATLALCVSCVGRHIVLGQRAVEEVERVRRALGGDTMLSGFYSYGELAPAGGFCQLHNQTMTITTLRED